MSATLDDSGRFLTTVAAFYARKVNRLDTGKPAGRNVVSFFDRGSALLRQDGAGKPLEVPVCSG